MNSFEEIQNIYEQDDLENLNIKELFEIFKKYNLTSKSDLIRRLALTSPGKDASADISSMDILSLNVSIDDINKKNDEDEPLLIDDNNRYTVFPLKYVKALNMYHKHFETIWKDGDLNLTTDISDWKKLNPDEKHFLKYVLAFFATSDGLVAENLICRFYNEIKHAEPRLFYGFQLMIEGVHGLVYSQFIETLIESPSEKNELFHAIDRIPCIIKKANWIKKWISSSDSFATRLVAFAIVEGIFFSGAFCAIYYIVMDKHLMPGLREANSYIARDEMLHCEFACMLYRDYIKHKHNSEFIYKLIQEAMEIEDEFINDALPCSLVGMNSVLMSNYLKFCADRLIMQLGYEPLYNLVNPFPFMDAICMTSQANFFDNRSSDYTINTNVDKNIVFDDDF